jgi:hypothetical protein
MPGTGTIWDETAWSPEAFQDSAGGRVLSPEGAEDKLRALRPHVRSVKRTGYVQDSPGGAENKLQPYDC